MTTPNQLPIDRAFVVGGTTVDGTTQTSYPATTYGQDFTDGLVKSLFEIPELTLGNALEVFTGLLLKLPMEALKVLGVLVPGGVEGLTDALSIVTEIVGSLTDAIQYLAEGDFEGFIDSLLSTLGIDGEGSILDKILDLSDGFGDWFGDSEALFGNFDDLLGGLLGFLGLDSLSDLASGDPTDLLTSFITGQLNPLALLEDGGIRDAVKELFDGLVSILRLIPFVGNDIADSLSSALDAVSGQTDIVVGNSATLSQVLAALSSGNPDADDFERTSSTNLGANWDQYQTGSGAKISTSNGHDAVFAINLLTAGEWVARKNNKQAAGDNQVSEVVFATVPATFGANGHNDVWLRMTTFSSYATRTGIRFRYSGNGAWSLDWMSSGTATNIGSGTASLKATAGATLRFEAGVGVTPRRFKAYMNGTPIMDVTEVGTTSQYGASYLYRGFGGKSESVLANFLPGSLRQWTAAG